MSGKGLLDTNIVIALFRNDAAVLGQLNQIDQTFVPSIVLGELYYGARKSNRVQENIQRIQNFTAGNTILNCDVETAPYYGSVRDDLRKKGRPIPENDIWIAAIAIQHDLTVITRDGHFNEVSGIRANSILAYGIVMPECLYRASSVAVDALRWQGFWIPAKNARE